MTIATDIICGFPTETEKDFEETITLCDQYKFPSLFINQFFPRPGTPAAKMQRIPANEVKIRTKQLTELFNSYSTYDNRLGEIQEVLVTDISHDTKYFVSHNINYEQVLVPRWENVMGKILTVKIVKVSKFCMFGEPLEDKIVSPGVSLPLQQGQVSGCGVELKEITLKTSNGFISVGVKCALFVLCFAFMIKLVCNVV